MRKDLKTGMLVGAAVVIATVAAMSVWPGQSVERRLMQSLTSGDGKTTVEPASDGKQHDKLPTPEPEPVAEYRVAVQQPEETDAVPIRKVTRTEPPEPQDERNLRIHVVADGQTLSSISVMYYGTSRQWKRILDANPKVIADENRLVPGMHLVIPR